MSHVYLKISILYWNQGVMKGGYFFFNEFSSTKRVMFIWECLFLFERWMELFNLEQFFWLLEFVDIESQRFNWFRTFNFFDDLEQLKIGKNISGHCFTMHESQIMVVLCSCLKILPGFYQICDWKHDLFSTRYFLRIQKLYLCIVVYATILVWKIICVCVNIQ